MVNEDPASVVREFLERLPDSSLEDLISNDLQDAIESCIPYLVLPRSSGNTPMFGTCRGRNWMATWRYCYPYRLPLPTASELVRGSDIVVSSHLTTIAESQFALAVLADLGRGNGDVVLVLRRLLRRARPKLPPRVQRSDSSLSSR